MQNSFTQIYCKVSLIASYWFGLSNGAGPYAVPPVSVLPPHSKHLFLSKSEKSTFLRMDDHY